MATYSSILDWRIPWTEELMSYSPWGCKQTWLSDWAYSTSEQLWKSVLFQTPFCRWKSQELDWHCPRLQGELTGQSWASRPDFSESRAWSFPHISYHHTKCKRSLFSVRCPWTVLTEIILSSLSYVPAMPIHIWLPSPPSSVGFPAKTHFSTPLTCISQAFLVSPVMEYHGE